MSHMTPACSGLGTLTRIKDAAPGLIECGYQEILVIDTACGGNHGRQNRFDPSAPQQYSALPGTTPNTADGG